MNTQQPKSLQRSIAVKTILVAISLLALFIVWWLIDSTGRKIIATDTTAQSIIQKNTQSSVNASLQDQIEEQSDEQKQTQLFNELWSKLHNADLNSTLTAGQLLDTPGFNTLSTKQIQRLVSEAMTLMQSNELDANVFLADLSHKDKGLNFVINENTNEVTVEQSETELITTEATPEQGQVMENVRQLLRDPETAETVTAAQLLQLAEVQNLPVHLRQQLTHEVLDMLSRGELNKTTFLATPPQDEVDTTNDEEARRADTTHQQWQTFENLRTRIYSPEFQADSMLSQILTSNEYKTLPAYLREQLSEEAVKIIENNNIY